LQNPGFRLENGTKKRVQRRYAPLHPFFHFFSPSLLEGGRGMGNGDQGCPDINNTLGGSRTIIAHFLKLRDNGGSQNWSARKERLV
jgi:hypothetical protein